MKSPLVFLPLTVLLYAQSQAATVAHWEFNDLTDSSGNGHVLTNDNTAATISGGQAVFSSTSATGLLSAADDAAWDDNTFTVESIFTYTAPSSAGISTIAAHLAASGGRQWLLGVTASKVPYLILSTNGIGETGYNSSFGPLVDGSTYYFGASVNLEAVDPADRITFYFQNISGSGTLQTGTKSIADTALNGSSAPFTIGSTGHASSRFTGSIDQVRYSDTPLTSNQLLVPEPSHALLSVVGLGILALRRKRA